MSDNARRVNHVQVNDEPHTVLMLSRLATHIGLPQPFLERTIQQTLESGNQTGFQTRLSDEEIYVPFDHNVLRGILLEAGDSVWLDRVFP